MKRYSKLLVSLLLALVIIFNTAACDVLANIPGFDLIFGTQVPGDDVPTDDPDENPTDKPNEDPTDDPDKDPTDNPNEDPTDKPDEEPTDKPNENPNTPSDKDPSDGNDGAFDGEDDPIEYPEDDPTKPSDTPDQPPVDDPENPPVEEEPEYVFGSEYADLIISVSLALEKAVPYTSSASAEIYYILVEIDDIVSLSKGTMYVSDETGSIYLYGTKDKDGNTLSDSDIAVGDIAVIAGPVRNYKGELEIEKGKVLAY